MIQVMPAMNPMLSREQGICLYVSTDRALGNHSTGWFLYSMARWVRVLNIYNTKLTRVTPELFNKDTVLKWEHICLREEVVIRGATFLF